MVFAGVGFVGGGAGLGFRHLRESLQGVSDLEDGLLRVLVIKRIAWLVFGRALVGLFAQGLDVVDEVLVPIFLMVVTVDLRVDLQFLLVIIISGRSR